MADYKIVDSGKLDTDLTVLADAIRQRSGTDGKLAFPSGMADAVKNIPSEGLNLPELADPAAPGDMAIGKSLFNHRGNVITGTVPVWDGLDFGRYICQEDGVQCGLGTDEDWIVLTTPPLEKRFMLETGAVATASRPLSDLGNASPEDVVAGKTFTSAVGLNASGTVKEVRTVYTTPHQKATMEWDDAWKASNILEEDVLLRKGTTVNTWFNQFFFGDAKPEDVRKGKFFSSGYALNQEGTMEAESSVGGIPYVTGSFTLAVEANRPVITHNLNSTKVFVMYSVRENPAIYTNRYRAIMGVQISNGAYPTRTIDISSYTARTDITEVIAGPDNNKNYTYIDVISPYRTDDYFNTSANYWANTDPNSFTLCSREAFLAGLTYDWVAVDVSGVLPWAEEG